MFGIFGQTLQDFSNSLGLRVFSQIWGYVYIWDVWIVQESQLRVNSFLIEKTSVKKCIENYITKNEIMISRWWNDWDICNFNLFFTLQHRDEWSYHHSSIGSVYVIKVAGFYPNAAILSIMVISISDASLKKTFNFFF